MSKAINYIDAETVQQEILELINDCDMYQVFPQDTLAESTKTLDTELALLRENLLETLTEYHTGEVIDDE